MILEIDILGATKVDSDWLIGRASSRIGIVPITYLKDTNTTQILFCGEDFYENIVELKQKEQIWILQEKNSQLQAQVSFRVENRASLTLKKMLDSHWLLAPNKNLWLIHFQLCQMEDEKQDLQSSLNQYQCCVICLIEIEQRAALSCGHSFWYWNILSFLNRFMFYFLDLNNLELPIFISQLIIIFQPNPY